MLQSKVNINANKLHKLIAISLVKNELLWSTSTFHLTSTNWVQLNESSALQIAFLLEWGKEESKNLKSIASNHGTDITDSLI